MTVLGSDFGDGVAAYQRGDYHTTLAVFKKLAEQGHTDAQTELGNMYGLGLGVPKDEQQAETWYRKAATLGNAVAQYKLGSIYRRLGTPKDDQQAVEWYRKSAEQGEDMAQMSLGQMLTEGKGAPKDDHQSVVWFRKAAEQGNARAQYNLGVKYYNGRGVPKDLQLAYFWWLLSSAQDNKEAVKSRDVLTPYLSYAQRSAAETSARNWQPRTAD